MIRYLVPFLLLLTALGCGGPSPQDGSPGAGSPGRPPGPPPAMDAAQRLEQTMQELTKRLQLTPALAEKVKAIIKAGEDQKEKMRPEGERYTNPRDMEKFFERLHQVDLETEKALAKVLTESQLKDYKDYLKEQRSRFGSGKGPGDGPGGGPPGGGKPGRRPGGY